ncbi:porin family protein [Aureimonas fodinaquatilis]|uniref:Porin family protein n=1 Tax=Aureimonas fodinaquatilis TaxID=2565783 RepID=A0A5B0DTT9_9HYPH|nr:outer membrane protein [Aureimonas fodinaquatilis]KAA0970227.1 porin family protein [Aureimonas fodinaquatilis]
MSRLGVISLVIAGLAVGAGPALAADAAPLTDLDIPVVSYPTHTWSGPYAGGFVGYNFAKVDAPGARISSEGFIGGVYAGYNLQSDRLVYGIEADAGASNVDGSASFVSGTPITSSSNAFGSLRARVGVTYDPILLFATGGVAVAENELSVPGAQDSATHFGWTLGGGIEAALGENVTSRVEYRYSDFNSRSYDLGNVTISSGYDEHSIRAGVALKF